MDKSKAQALDEVQEMLKEKGFEIVSTDFDRPWGGFFVIDESQAREFIDAFFVGSRFGTLVGSLKVSPKFLVVQPGKRLSWQYHLRRSEVWRIFKGSVGVVRSDNDEPGEMVTATEGEQVVLKQGERHRLVGLDDFAVVAEIWQHSLVDEMSNEDDIVRLQDDFGR